MKNFIGIALILGAVVGIYKLNEATRDKDGKSVLHVADPLKIAVEVADPRRQDIVQTVQAPGEVEALSEVDISAEVVAKILEMPVEEGDTVKKGDLLCRLDDADYRARITSAEANIAKLRAMIVQAEADFEKADRDYRRQLRLVEADATSMSELADYRTTRVRAGAMVDIRGQELIEAEGFLKQAEEDIARTVITSPIDGIVSQRFAKEGEVVITGTMNNPGTRIMVISDLSEMQVRCRVDESDALLVAEGQTARIYLQSDAQKSIPGTVLRVATKGTKPPGRDVVTFETLVLVDGSDGRVKPGMTASVEIEVAAREDALTIPVQAIVHRKRKDLPEELLKQAGVDEAESASPNAQRAAEYLKIVFCIEDEVARPHIIRIGIVDAKNVEIVNGISATDRVVIGPFRSLDQLKDGAKVKIEGDDMVDEDAKEELAESDQASDVEPSSGEKEAMAGGR